MRFIGSSFIAPILLSGLLCGASSEFIPVHISGRQGMIVTASLADHSGVSKEGYWTPTKAELIEAERLLPQFLEQERRSLPQINDLTTVIARAPTYRRQYIGIISRGAKIIWINCFPAKPAKGSDPYQNWNREIIDVSDGGAKYWGAMFDVKKRSFERLILNGPG